MKVCAISDLHGILPTIENCDILFICGDISPLDIQRSKPLMKEWIETEFLEWVNNVPCEKIYCIAGNHDFYFENITDSAILDYKILSKGKFIYIENQTVKHVDNNGKTWSIFGTPFCHIFGRWSFMVEDDFMEEKFKKIPENVDFILSHDPPYEIGNVDSILDSFRNIGRPEHVGNIPLSNRLKDITFKWLFCGHIHSGDHNPCIFNGGNVVNVSILDERYENNYEPFYIEVN